MIAMKFRPLGDRVVVFGANPGRIIHVDDLQRSCRG